MSSKKVEVIVLECHALRLKAFPGHGIAISLPAAAPSHHNRLACARRPTSLVSATPMCHRVIGRENSVPALLLHPSIISALVLTVPTRPARHCSQVSAARFAQPSIAFVSQVNECLRWFPIILKEKVDQDWVV